MLHRDHNYHSEAGKLKTDLPAGRTEDFISPEVPFRIQAIYDYLRTEPASEPLLTQMERIEHSEADWATTLSKVHPEEHIKKFEQACARLESG